MICVCECSGCAAMNVGSAVRGYGGRGPAAERAPPGSPMNEVHVDPAVPLEHAPGEDSASFGAPPAPVVRRDSKSKMCIKSKLMTTYYASGRKQDVALKRKAKDDEEGCQGNCFEDSCWGHRGAAAFADRLVQDDKETWYQGDQAGCHTRRIAAALDEAYDSEWRKRALVSGACVDPGVSAIDGSYVAL